MDKDMVIFCSWRNRSVTISEKPNCLTLSLEETGRAEVFSFDYAGRLWTALLDSVSYRRGLDGKMVAKWQESGGGRGRRWLLRDETLQVEEHARQTVRAFFADVQSGKVHLSDGLGQLGRLGFERLIAFDSQHSKVDASRYLQVYRPVGILPPDQYMAVVLQLTEGCAFNTCTYCTFYRDRPFRIKLPDEFRKHAHAVKEFVGDGMSLRRTIFLGDANALITPQERLVPLLHIVHQVYNVEELGGIFAFLDGFSGTKKTARDYRALAELGMKRVYIGLESGNEALLHFLKKPGKPSDAVDAVRAMKAGGVSVGVIVLLGAGGHTYASDHIRDTIQVLNSMNLDMDDLVYFSELFVNEGMEYVREAYAAQLEPLSPAERLTQGEEIERGLKFTGRGIPHISRYDIREFVY
jgi:hypothetical protein